MSKVKRDEKAVKKQKDSSSDDDSSSEEVQIVKKDVKKVAAPVKVAKKQESDSSSDSSSDEKPAAGQKRAAPAQVQKKGDTKKPKVEESSSDDDSSEEKPKAKVQPKAVATPANTQGSKQTKVPVKVAKKESSSDSSEDDSSEEKPKKTAAKPQPAKAQPAKAKKESSSDEDSEESEKPKKTAKVAKKQESSDEDDKEMSEEQKPVAPKSAPAQATGDEPREVFVGNLSFKSDENSIREYLTFYGEVTKVKVLSDQQGRSKGVAFVEFADHASAQKCVTEGGSLDGRDLKINFSNQKPAGARAVVTDPSAEGSDTLFCGNLKFEATEDDLRALFETVGEVRDIRIAKDESGSSRGFAHIQYMSPDDAKEALSLNGQMVNGRPVRLDLSAPKKPGFGGGGRSPPPRRGGFNQRGPSRPASARGSIVQFQGNRQKF